MAGEDPLMGQYGYVWQADLTTADAIFRQALTSRIITAKHAALAMMPAKRGLIVEVTESDMMGGGGNPAAQVAKIAQKVLPLIENNNWFFDTELLVFGEKGGWKLKEVPVKWVEDPDTRTRFPHDVIKMTSQMLKLRFRKMPKPQT